MSDRSIFKSINRRRLLVGTAATATVLATPAILRAQEVFRVGIIRPLTGPLASSFEGNFAAATIGIDEINANGGVLGMKVEKFEVDDAGAPAQQPIAMRQIIQAGVNVVIGPVGSSQTLASLAISSRSKVIQAGYVTADEAAEGTKYPYHYMCSISVSMQAELFVKYLISKGASKIGILVEDSAAGTATLDALNEAIPAAGMTITSSQIAPLRSNDMTPFLRELRSSGAEDLIVFVSNSIDTTQCFVGLNRLNWKPPVVGHTGLAFATFADAIPAEARYPEVYATTLKALTFTETETPTERTLAYVRKILDMGLPIGSLAPAATSPFYDFIKVVAHAANQAGSTESDAIKEQLDSLSGFDGLFGPIGFTPEDHLAYTVDAVTLAPVFPEESTLFKETSGLVRPRAM